jgi:thiol-disulfide isomerase/thioredoxin
MDLFDKYHQGMPYGDFLTRYASEAQKQRWQQVRERVKLSPEQRSLLASFGRRMPVLCLAGAWCGDCTQQCPIFEEFAAAAPVIQVRYLDRDVHAEVQRELQINGGNRVPAVVFFSEDGFEVARYGERTLAKYRQMMREQAGSSCPTGHLDADQELFAQVTREWLDQFERVQWILRLSPRLRERHGD